MAVWEPTAEEFASFKTLTDVVSWSKMLPEVSDSFMDSIGASGQEHPCVLGMMEHEEVQEVIKDLKVGYKSLNLMQKGHIRTVMHVCKLVAGTETTANVQKELEGRLNQVVTDITKVAEEAKAAAASQSEKVGGPQVPLKHVVSQGSEETVPKISAEEMTKHWDRFSSVYGRDPRPEEECTADQRTGVDTLLKRDMAPYVDFGIWGPNHHRLLKKLRNTGLQLHMGGVLRHIEISGLRVVTAPQVSSVRCTLGLFISAARVLQKSTAVTLAI